MESANERIESQEHLSQEEGKLLEGVKKSPEKMKQMSEEMGPVMEQQVVDVLMRSQDNPAKQMRTLSVCENMQFTDSNKLSTALFYTKGNADVQKQLVELGKNLIYNDTGALQNSIIKTEGNKEAQNRVLEISEGFLSTNPDAFISALVGVVVIDNEEIALKVLDLGSVMFSFVPETIESAYMNANEFAKDGNSSLLKAVVEKTKSHLYQSPSTLGWALNKTKDYPELQDDIMLAVSSEMVNGKNIKFTSEDKFAYENAYTAVSDNEDYRKLIKSMKDFYF